MQRVLPVALRDHQRGSHAVALSGDPVRPLQVKDDLPDRAFLLQSDEEYDIRSESRAFPVFTAEKQREELRAGDGAAVVLILDYLSF